MESRGTCWSALTGLRFPGQAQVSGNAKVPSLLYYDKSGNVRAAGAEVLTEDVIETALTEGWTKAEWWKLHLRPKHLASSINKDNDLPPLPSGKSAIHVFIDFIRYLFQCAKTYIQEHKLELAWSTIEGSIEYVFTHPDGWESVQQQYRRAIVLAGFIPGTPEGQSRVHVLTEGEASLRFCVASLVNAETTDQTTPQGAVIIDVGRRTIDLSMFSMTFNPFSCEGIAPAECRLQGSDFVTHRARILLEKKLEGWEHSSPDEITEFTREFDQSTKLVIKSDEEPAYVRVAGRRTNIPKYNISFGKLKLTGEEATGLFNESFDAIIDAFEQQQKSATTPITTVFCVGEFSIYNWLQPRVQSYFKGKNITICCPDNNINKVVANGAVLSHIDHENHKVTSRVARAAYGVVCALPVKANDEEHIRRKHRWEIDPTGECYVPDYFETKFLKGGGVGEKMEFLESFSLSESDPANFGKQAVRLECYRGNLRDPKWVDEDPSFFVSCIIHVDLSQAVNDLTKKQRPSGQIYYQLDYDVIIYSGLVELQAYLRWKTKDGEHQIPAVSFTFDAEDEESLRGLRQPRKVRHAREQLESSGHKAQSAPSLDDDQDVEQSDLPEDQLSSHDGGCLGPASSHDKLASTVTATIATVTKITTVITARIEHWRDEVIRNKEQITILGMDLDRLLSDLSNSSSQMTRLQQDSTELSKDSSSVHHRLEVTLSLCDEKDRSITSLTAEDAAKAQQITALHRDNELLRHDFSAASSEMEGLQQCHHLHSEELVSANKELKSMALVIKERDCSIASFTTQVAQLQRSNDEKTEHIATARLEYEKLQRDTSQIVELRKRCDALSKERDSLWNELRDSKTFVEEKDGRIAVLNAEVGKWKRVDATKIKQLNVERQEKEKLQKILAAVSSQTANLQEHCDMQSKENVSLLSELQTKAALLAEREHTITSFTAELGQARRKSDTQEELITAARQDAEQLREKLSVAWDEKADLQKRFDAQLVEINNLYNELDRLKIIGGTADAGISDGGVTGRIPLALEKKEKQVQELRQELAATTSRYNDLQISHEALSGKVNALGYELKVKMSQYEGAKDTITSLTAQVNQLRAMHADKTEQLATARNQIRDLQLEVTTLTSQFTELRSCYATQSRELISMSNRLQIMTLSNQEKEHDKDRAVAAFTDEIAELKRTNALDDERILAARRQVKDFQLELTNSRCRITELQHDNQMQLTELDFLQRRLEAVVSGEDATMSFLATQAEGWKELYSTKSQELMVARRDLHQLRHKLDISSSRFAELRQELTSQIMHLQRLDATKTVDIRNLTKVLLGLT